MSTSRKLSLSDNVEVAVAATGAVIALDQTERALESEEHQLSHAIKAAIGAAVAIGAWEQLNSHDKSTAYNKQANGPTSRKQTARGDSPNPKHHNRHLAEEVIGAYALGKELLGDRKHHIAHLVAEALGATGLYKELTEKEQT